MDQNEEMFTQIMEEAVEENTLSTIPYFFTTSTLKLTLMSICTFGLYDIYWFYKNWILIGERTGQNIKPLVRAIFAPIFTYSCFRHVKNAAKENDIFETLSIGSLTFAYIFLGIAARFPAPYSLMSFFGFAIIILVNNVALDINKKMVTDFENNDKFSGWNKAIIAIGGLGAILSVIGSFLPKG